MNANKTLTIDGIPVPIGDERNLLEVVRNAGIDIPTFCYHSEISIYGACRLCMVDIEGRGLVPSCSTLPESGMVVRTNTGEIRAMRKMIVELMLASHDQECPTCSKSDHCQLQKLSRRMGIHDVRFKKSECTKPLDTSSPALVRDPNKCVLCGDCVRVCEEIQSVGALDFANRGSDVVVTPAFGKMLNSVECVSCGQCAKVCPVGAIIPKSHMDKAWRAIHDPKKTVIAQVAPAVRVAVGEEFGFAPGASTSGQMVAALRRMGFDRVFDTSFTADLTVIEEANEFLSRLEKANGRSREDILPQFTSCCPAWVRFAEQYYADMLPNLSSCRSPQQMFGSLSKDVLAREDGLDREDLVVISIMPCTAKKYEAERPEYTVEGNPDVDVVLTTQEIVLMIQESGLDFQHVEPESFDMPFGFKTGGGLIFGNSGGVSEAVLRYASEKVAGRKLDGFEFHQVRGADGLREAEVAVGDTTLRLAVVSGLGNARKLVDRIRSGAVQYDLIEVMACPGGCVNGAGQPPSVNRETIRKRTKGLYDSDRMMPLHKAQENPYIREVYDRHLSHPGSEKAHSLLHTGYQNRRRIEGEEMVILPSGNESAVKVSICFGTSCFLRGAQDLYRAVVDWIAENHLEGTVELSASFCNEECKKGPVIQVEDVQLTHCTAEQAIAAIERRLETVRAGVRP